MSLSTHVISNLILEGEKKKQPKKKAEYLLSRASSLVALCSEGSA